MEFSCGTSWFGSETITLPGSQHCLPLYPKTFLVDPENDNNKNEIRKNEKDDINAGGWEEKAIFGEFIMK